MGDVVNVVTSAAVAASNTVAAARDVVDTGTVDVTTAVAGVTPLRKWTYC